MPKYIVSPTPAQVKKRPHLGNIYDWVLTDFYSKFLRLEGNEVVTPLIWNSLGYPITKMLRDRNMDVNAKNVDVLVAQCIDTNEKYLKKLDINLHPVYRDDKLVTELQYHLNNKYLGKIFEKNFVGKYCACCDKVLGTDMKIEKCKWCNSAVVSVTANGFFVNADISDIKQKADRIKFIPESIKRSLLNFAETLPRNYDVLISKNREYTTEVMINGKKVQLDPRFATIMAVTLINSMHAKDQTSSIIIHGDVVKKFDYYNLVYNTCNFIPSVIVGHSVCLGSGGKKIRVADNESVYDLDNLFETYSPQIIRGFLLSRDISYPVSISESGIEEVKTIKSRLSRIINELKNHSDKGSNVLNYDNVDVASLDFHNFAREFKLHNAFISIARIIKDINKSYLPKLRDSNLQADRNLIKLVKVMHSLYFGGSLDE
jgi:leucyl-tRNA synthetase